MIIPITNEDARVLEDSLNDDDGLYECIQNVVNYVLEQSPLQPWNFDIEIKVHTNRDEAYQKFWSEEI